MRIDTPWEIKRWSKDFCYIAISLHKLSYNISQEIILVVKNGWRSLLAGAIYPDTLFENKAPLRRGLISDKEA